MKTEQRSSNQFCRCGHNRSFHWTLAPHICREPRCECVKHDTATMPKPAKLTVVDGELDPILHPAGHTPAVIRCPCGWARGALVEPSPNAMARDAAVRLLRLALAQLPKVPPLRHQAVKDIDAAIVCLEAIS